VEDEIAMAGRSPARVLLSGPSASANEAFARLIHARSPRAEAPFIRVNCEITDQALEVELFGFSHDRAAAPVGAGAGVVRGAGGGTILLAGVDSLSHRMQALLCNWLLGAERRRQTEIRLHAPGVRLISATTKDLHEALEAGAFRADLYYCLNQIHLCVDRIDSCESDSGRPCP
jgi:DNA-binding NtrC family response regulator